MPAPLVSVICICYNHERFVEDAILSIIKQTYSNVEIWVVDNGSEDNSVQIIQSCLKEHPNIQFVRLPKGVSYPKAFNKAFAQIKGDFVIDLAGDDMLMPNRILEGLNDFKRNGPDYGVHFSDGWMIDQSGKEVSLHSDRFPHAQIPEGDIYKALVARYFILTPSMMIRTSLLNSLGGYDEHLSYEDFDFWVRSSRIAKYCYSSKALVKKRVVLGSMSANQYQFGSPHLASTFKVCEKILKMNQNIEEDFALKTRIYYEAWQTLKVGRLDLAFQFLKIWFKLKLR